MNSNRSGSCHLAKSWLRWSRSSSAVTSLAVVHDDRRQRPLAPPLVRDGDHRRLGDARVGHQQVLEVDRGDPLAAGLDQVLGPVADADAAASVDLDDVAGLEPAVVGELLGAAAAVVGGARPTVPGPRARPSSRRPTGSARRRRRGARSSTNGEGDALADRGSRTAPRARRRRARRGSRQTLPSGEVSVIPHAWMIVSPWRVEALEHALRDRRAADDQALERAQVPAVGLGVRAPAASPSTRSGTPAVSVTRSSASRSSTLSGSSRGPGSTSPAPANAAAIGQPPRVGVEHRHDRQDRVARGRRRSVRQRRHERVQDQRAVRVDDALRAGPSCPTCNTWPRPGALGDLWPLHRLGVVEQRLVVEHPVGHLAGAGDDDHVLEIPSRGGTTRTPTPATRRRRSPGPRRRRR